MINIAILGFGVVGGGVAEVLNENHARILAATGEEINVKYIFDKRSFPHSPYASRVTSDINMIMSDSEVSVIVETMGGVHPSFEFTLAAMNAGKSVITSNKEVVAKCGVELMAEAAKRGVSYLFEAAVGGGIPLIRPVRTSLAGDRITRIDGILNGTTNYMLTSMKYDKKSFDEALDEARQLGYAEADPSADVDGLDTQRKIIILTALATGMLMEEGSVPTETMRNITKTDIDAATRTKHSIKLIGSSRIGEKTGAFVYPFFVPEENPVSRIDGVYNGVSFTSPVTGDVMFYGRGAGRYPTAGAVVSDIVSVASGAAKHEAATNWHRPEEGELLSPSEIEFPYYVRIRTDSPESVLENARNCFGGITKLDGSPEGTVEFFTNAMTDSAALELIDGGRLGGQLESRLRVFK